MTPGSTLTGQRIFGNPTPLGLLSWGYGLFLYSAAVFRTQGLSGAAAVVPALIFFGGVSQTFCAWWEMSLGNTFMATVFGVFGAFSLSLGCMHVPAFGLAGTPDFEPGLGLFLLSFMMVFTLILLGALKTSVNVLATLATAQLFSLLLGAHYLSGSEGLRIAAATFGMLATAASWWTAITGLWTADVTFLRSPVVMLYTPPRDDDIV